MDIQTYQRLQIIHKNNLFKCHGLLLFLSFHYSIFWEKERIGSRPNRACSSMEKRSVTYLGETVGFSDEADLLVDSPHTGTDIFGLGHVVVLVDQA